MNTNHHPGREQFLRGRRTTLVLLAAATVAVASLASVSAHVVRGVGFPSLAVAFVSSPTATLDAPIRLMWGAVDTGMSVACFYTANTSPPSSDPQWPRITAVGFELPEQRSGFVLMEPRNGEWDLVEGANAVLSGRGVAVDFALVLRGNSVASPGQPGTPRGIPPGQAAARGNGTRFCVSGPFPTDMTIEEIINGVVVRFQQGPATDLGIWDNALRLIPLYPN